MFTKVTAVIMIMLLCFAAGAYAQEEGEHNAITKLGQGVINGTTFWLEFPKQIYNTTKEDDILVGLTYGLVKGVAYSVLRLASGVYDITTMPIPPYDRVLLEPKFVFEGWE